MFQDYQQQDPYYAREAEKYPEPIPSREYILQCLNSLGHPVYPEQVIEMFGLDTENTQDALRRRLIAMERNGQLMRNRRGKYAVVAQLELVRGRVIGHKDGFGFLIPDDNSGDLYLAPYQMRSLFPGDIVLARSTEGGFRGKREGVVVEILERHTTELVGRYFKEKNIAFVQPNHKQITQDILIPPGEEAGAKHGQIVMVQISTQPTPRRQATGHIVEILGDHLSPGMEIEVALRSYGLPHHWPETVQEEVSHWSGEIPETSQQDRVDLRHLPLVTIDGEDAKDFDDAVYCEPRPKDGWRLIVAIADVSYYVQTRIQLSI